jgi:hypothetical protein
MQMNLGGKVQLVIVNVLGNLHVLLVSRNPYDIPTWNQKVDEYIDVVFDFIEKFLASYGAILLFHPYDMRVVKEAKFYPKSYGF